jgi:uncharacterized protein involved in exopolysaccharide biosynthesis
VYGRQAGDLGLWHILELLFRHWRVMTIAFTATFCGAILVAIFMPPKYAAHLKVLVRHQRVEPVITTSSNGVRTITPEDVTDEEIDSEIELFRSEDLLRRVVQECGLDKTKPHFWTATLEKWSPTSPAVRTSKAVARLRSAITVERVQKSSFIEVSYGSDDPKRSAAVVNLLGQLFAEKHVAVHRSAGQFKFLASETDRYRQRLADAEAKLAAVDRSGQAPAAETDRNNTLQKVAELEYNLRQTRSAAAAARQRISALESQLKSTTPRLNTQMKKADNPALLQQLKSTLLELELKRTDLLSKYDPTYIGVKDIETQIAQTRAAIERETSSPVQENTTDRNPTYEWLSSELAKATADLPTLEANAKATEAAIAGYRQMIMDLDQKSIVQLDLIRNVKAEEENYLLYLKKQEEAHIAEQMDDARISNVVISEAAAVPVLPTTSPLSIALRGLPLGLLVSVGAAFVSGYLDTTLHTADEVWDVLSVPVLASLPATRELKLLN